MCVRVIERVSESVCEYKCVSVCKIEIIRVGEWVREREREREN